MDLNRAETTARAPIDDAILTLCYNRPIQMFSDLAQALPHYNWRQLFIVLHRLASQRRIELVRHPWDYEIISESVYSAYGKPNGTVVNCDADKVTEAVLQKAA